jgi:outer membrane usher protein
LALQFSRRAMRDTGAISQFALTSTAPVGRNLSFSLTAERDTGTQTGGSNGLLATLNVAVGRSDASMGVRSGSDGTHQTLQVQRSPQGPYGLRYVASMDSGAGSSVNGLFEERTRYGDYDLQYSDSPASGFGEQLRASGGIILADGRAYATRPVTGSFALVEVPGLSGIHVYVENQDAGTTGRDGRLVVPDLIPNYGNVLRIEDSTAPLNASIQTVQKTVAPPARGGAVVVFPVEQLQALSGKLLVVDGNHSVVPAYGDLTIHSKTFDGESGIGTSGEFYLENVPAGAYDAHIIYAGGDCSFTLKAPDMHTMLVMMGTVRCVKS